MKNIILKTFTFLLTLVFLFSSTIAPALAAMTYTYDANGNMTSDGEKCFHYNEANQMDKVSKCSNNETIAEYVYDYTGKRIVKKEFENGVLKRTVYSPSDEYETTKIASTGATQNTTYYKVNDEVVAKKNPDGTKEYIHNDHLGSTSVVTDQNGQKKEETKYDPRGVITQGGKESKYNYTGQEHDAETGLDYYEYRYYNSHIRRFAQPDDIIQDPYSPQTLNRYSYVMNNPLRYTDPTGHYAETPFDIAFISMDLYNLKQEPSNPWNYAALGADGLGTALPVVTGLGLGVKATEQGVKSGVVRQAVTNVAKTVKANPTVQKTTQAIQQKASASQRQMKELGYVIAGTGSKTIFRDAPKFVNQYGGKVTDWVKKTSTTYKSPDKKNFQTHWVENVKTGFRTWFKTKFTYKRK